MSEAAVKKSTKELIDIDAEAKAMMDALKDRVGTSKWIKTGVKEFILPDGSTNDVLNGVLLDYRASQRYFKDVYEEGVLSFPVCAAVGQSERDLVPFESSPDMQAPSCTDCWAYQFESAAVGKGKACKAARIAAFLPPDATDTTPILFLNIAPKAIAGFDNYIKSLRNKDTLPIGVVTQVSFDKSLKYNRMEFTSNALNPRWKEMWPRVQEAAKQLDSTPNFGND